MSKRWAMLDYTIATVIIKFLVCVILLFNLGKIKGVTVFAGIMILLAVGILISSLTFGIIAKRNIIKEKIFKRDIPSTLPQNVSEQLPDFLEYRDISDLNETGTGNNTNNVELSRLPDCSADLDSQNKAYKA